MKNRKLLAIVVVGVVVIVAAAGARLYRTLGSVEKDWAHSFPVNGCTPEKYEDRSAGERVIRFGGTLGEKYAPRCVRIKVGQEIIWNGDFGALPLKRGRATTVVPPNEGAGVNPIPESTSDGATATVAFPATGVFPFHSPGKESIGMYGAVDVR